MFDLERLSFVELTEEDYLSLMCLLELSNGFSSHRSIELFHEQLKSGRLFVSVVKVEGDIVGCGSLHLYDRAQGGTVGVIEDVFVSDSFRRRGYANAIIMDLVEVARSNHVYKIVLESSYVAHNLYKQCGFSRGDNNFKLLLN